MSCHLKPTSGPAIKDAHGASCYCGAPATVHVFYGPGCGNVCRKHAERVRRRYRAAQIEELDDAGLDWKAIVAKREKATRDRRAKR